MTTAAQDTAGPVVVRPVRTRRDLSTFIRVAHLVYRDDPVWVPPLHVERRMHLSAKHNPYFDHARWQAWVAYRGRLPVGRISAQIDDLDRSHHGRNRGHFGMIEALDDAEVFSALFEASEKWLSTQGAERILGPFNLSINQ